MPAIGAMSKSACGTFESNGHIHNMEYPVAEHGPKPTAEVLKKYEESLATRQELANIRPGELKLPRYRITLALMLGKPAIQTRYFEFTRGFMPHIAAQMQVCSTHSH